MGVPPRLSEILLDWDQAIIYFVTLCVNNRGRVLANPEVFDGIQKTASGLRNWKVLAGVVMPDHVHFVVTPRHDRGLSIGEFSSAFKRLLRKSLSEQQWEWQRGCFDRLLRSDENLQNKWIYVEENPIRAGLVQNTADWPYYLGSISEQQMWQPMRTSVGEAGSFPNHKNGKLTASPTEKRA